MSAKHTLSWSLKSRELPLWIERPSERPPFSAHVAAGCVGDQVTDDGLLGLAEQESSSV